MKTAYLSDALLDYWTARAEGVSADQLELRANGTLCVRNMPVVGMTLPMVLALDYSTNWALTGPLMEKWAVSLDQPHWYAKAWKGGYWSEGIGDTPLIAICRAVVRAAFGDEVEDLP